MIYIKHRTKGNTKSSSFTALSYQKMGDNNGYQKMGDKNGRSVLNAFDVISRAWFKLIVMNLVR